MKYLVEQTFENGTKKQHKLEANNLSEAAKTAEKTYECEGTEVINVSRDTGNKHDYLGVSILYA